MRRILVLTFFAVLPAADADERMADTAAYINAVWFAEEFNKHCPDSLIKISVTESELRKLLVMKDGSNFVDVVARDPNISNLNFRDEMKDTARASTAEGCNSDTAVMLKARVEKELTIPDLVAELMQESDDNR